MTFALPLPRVVRRVPGFRSGEPWKQVFAVVSYLLVIAFATTGVLEGLSPRVEVSKALANGGFESGSVGWNLSADAVIDNSQANAHSGKSSLKLVAKAPWQASIQAILVTPGQPYNFTGWGRATASDGHFSIFTYGSNGDLLGTPFDRTFPGSRNWIEISAVYVPPAGAVQAQLLLQNSSAGTFWFDDITLRPGNNALDNSGFEAGVESWKLPEQAFIDAVPAHAHSGNHALELRATAPWQETYQSVTVIGGHSYSFTGWGSSATSGGHFSLLSFDINQVRIGSFDRVFAGIGGWQYVSGVYVPPPTAVRVDVALQSSTSGTYWFDDVDFGPTNNLVDNGNFEFGPAGWKLSAETTVNSSAAHSGHNSMRLAADAPWEGASQSIPVTDGQTYLISGWERSGSDGGHLTIISFDTNDREIGERVDLTLRATNGWVLFVTSYRPPKGTTRIDLWLQSSAPGVFWFDDIAMAVK